MGIRGNYKNKRDANEKIIFAILRSYGIQVEPTDEPLDAICAYKGVNYLVEVKDGPKARYTPKQKEFMDRWQGQYVVLRSEQEAFTWAQEITGH